MIIAGVFSFNGGEEAVRTRYPYLLAEVADVIASVDAEQHRTKISTEKTMMGRVLYSPSSLNKAFKQQFGLRDWHNRKVICDYPVDFYTSDYIVKKPAKVRSIPFRDMDFVKDKLGIEVQFGKYAFMVYNVCSKMIIFKNLDIIDAGIELDFVQ